MTSSPICRWKSETAPGYEVEVRRREDGVGLKASLINRLSNTTVDYKFLDTTAVFERCVWRSNDFPENAPLEGRFFRHSSNRKGTWIGMDFNNGQARLLTQTFPNFDDTELRTKALVFNTANQQVVLQPVGPENNPANESQGELGMIRPTANSAEEVVHIWSHVGIDGKCDLRLIHQRSQEQEDLLLRLFYRSTWNTTNITLSNRSPLLTNRAIAVEDRITSYRQHPIAILGERSGDAYGTVTLSSPTDAAPGLVDCFGQKNLQSTPDDEIATYVRDQLFVMRDPQGQITSAVSARNRVVVTRERPYDFGPLNGGKLDAVHIHMSQTYQWIRMPFAALMGFFSGMFNSDAPRIYQLRGLNEAGMQDLLQESSGLATPLDKPAIFQEFDRAIKAGANIDYYISEDRKAARFHVGGVSLAIRSGATSMGRGLSLRFWWDPQPAQTPNVNQARAASRSFAPRVVAGA